MPQFTLDSNRCRTIGVVTVMVCLLVANQPAPAQDREGAESAETSRPIVLKLDYKHAACAAHLSLEYYQRGEHAHVKTVLDNEDCAASFGTYTLQVRFRDADNKVHNIEYDETWSRNDNLSIESAKDYFAGQNVDLVRVRSRQLKCECKAAPAQVDESVGNGN